VRFVSWIPTLESLTDEQLAIHPKLRFDAPLAPMSPKLASKTRLI
jgi:hypothetical protein